MKRPKPIGGKRREAGPVFIMLRSGRVVFVTDKEPYQNNAGLAGFRCEA